MWTQVLLCVSLKLERKSPLHVPQGERHVQGERLEVYPAARDDARSNKSSGDRLEDSYVNLI